MRVYIPSLQCLFVVFLSTIGLIPYNDASAIQIRPDSCTDAVGEQGVCMFVWECIKQEGYQLGPCVDRFLVGTCCSLPNSQEQNDIDSNNANQIKPDSSNVHSTLVTFVSSNATSKFPISNGSLIEASHPRQKSTTPTTSKPDKKPEKTLSQCGIPFPQPKMKVVGGSHASFGDWPWQVSVRRTSFLGFASTHRCGGAILNELWIATAGHCVDDLLMSQIRVRAGEFDFNSVKEPFPFQERSIIKKIVHPRYNFYTYENDLALLKLESPFELQAHVKPICLPPQNDTFVGRNATVTGWGRLSDGGTLPSMLQQVEVPIVSNEKCKQMFKIAGRMESIPDIFLCAGYEKGGRDSCQGDSGGPLQVRGDDGRWFLAGIISWGIGCAEPNMPGVCTRVNKFTDWIEETMYL